MCLPDSDATVVTKLAQAGTVMLGKLAMYEFALNGSPYGMPLAPRRETPGIQEHSHVRIQAVGNLASAIAAGLIMGGSGVLMTGGSIRSPAALCGTSGIKPIAMAVAAERAPFPWPIHSTTLGRWRGRPKT